MGWQRNSISCNFYGARGGLEGSGVGAAAPILSLHQAPARKALWCPRALFFLMNPGLYQMLIKVMVIMKLGRGGCLAGEGLTLLVWEGCLPPASLRRDGGEGAAGDPTLSRPPRSSAKRGRGQVGAGPCRALGPVPAAPSGLPRSGARPRVPRHPLLQVGGCPPPARC